MAEEREDMAEEGEATAKLRAWFEGAGAGLRHDDGQTLLEYALIIGFIGMGTIAAMWALGPAIGDAFQVVTDALTGVGFPA